MTAPLSKNVNLFLCLTKHHAVKTYWGSGCTALTMALDGGEWLASRPDRFTPGTQWIGGGSGTIICLDEVA